MQTGPVNLLSHPSVVYIRESTLGHSVIDSIGPRSCIRRIPSKTDHGAREYDDLEFWTHDYIDCSGLVIRSLNFRRTDEKEKPIPFETPTSLSLVFSQTHM